VAGSSDDVETLVEEPEADPDQLTSPGTMLGTVAYMSPEQVRARDLDARTDLFSFGTVLYEMATGRIPFDGSSPGDICGAILYQNPPPASQVNPLVPLRLEGIIQKALEKDPNLRYQHAGDMRSDLQRLKRDTESGRSETAISGSAAVAQKVPVAQPKKRWLILVPAAGFLVASLIAGGIYYRSHQARPLTNKDTIVLADFINTTGDSVFDGTLRQGLASQLEQSPFLSLVSDDQLAKTLMERPKDARLTHQLAREVCQRAGGKAAIEGSISGLGSPYRLELNAADCQSGRAGGDEEDRRIERAGSPGAVWNGGQHAPEAGRIAGLGAEVRCACRKRHDRLARSAAGLQPGRPDPVHNWRLQDRDSADRKGHRL
jgi:hypothetical protein